MCLILIMKNRMIRNSTKNSFEEGITFITDQPKRANRLISITRLSCTGVSFMKWDHMRNERQ